MDFDLEDTRRELIGLVKAHGAETPIGRGYSNVVELLKRLPYVREPWATDERQTVPYLISYQLQRIERLKAAAH